MKEDTFRFQTCSLAAYTACRVWSNMDVMILIKCMGVARIFQRGGHTEGTHQIVT